MKGKAGKTLSVTIFPSFGRVVSPKLSWELLWPKAGWCRAQAGEAVAGHVNSSSLLDPG